MSEWDNLKAFLTRGNVVDMAVGVVIGLAFMAIVNALVTDLITPLISIPGPHDFSSYSFGIGGGKFLYGAFITAVINFILIAVTVFFVIVRPVQMMEERRKAKVAAEPPTTRECPACLSKVPIKATRCAFCTTNLTPPSS